MSYESVYKQFKVAEGHFQTLGALICGTRIIYGAGIAEQVETMENPITKKEFEAMQQRALTKEIASLRSALVQLETAVNSFCGVEKEPVSKEELAKAKETYKSLKANEAAKQVEKKPDADE